MKVYTFQHDWPNSHNEWKRQIWLWQQNWKQRGFEPVVLSLEDAKQHPKYSELSEAVLKYPTVNDRVYEHACFVRHLAFDLAGAELISDYDVINREWPAENFSRVRETFLERSARPLSLDAGRNVCLAVFGPESRALLLSAFLDPVRVLATSQTHGGRQHVSDMTVFMSLCRRYDDKRPFCDTWGNAKRLYRDSFRLPPCIHVNNDSLVQIGIPPGNKSSVMGDLILGRRSFLA